jgi:hypothetical protein
MSIAQCLGLALLEQGLGSTNLTASALNSLLNFLLIHVL